MKKVFIGFSFLLVLFLSSCSITQPEEITIHFETNGGKQIETMVFIGEIEALTLPTTMRDGFEFVGWYTDKALTNLVDIMLLNGVKEITLYAKWHELITDPDKIYT